MRATTIDPIAITRYRPYSHHPYAYALGNPVNFTDPAGTCAVGESGPRGCDPSFEYRLHAYIDRTAYGSNADYYETLALPRGGKPLFLFFDANAAAARDYVAPTDIAWVNEDLWYWRLDRGINPDAALQAITQNIMDQGGALEVGAAFFKCFQPGGMLHQFKGMLGGNEGVARGRVLGITEDSNLWVFGTSRDEPAI